MKKMISKRFGTREFFNALPVIRHTPGYLRGEYDFIPRLLGFGESLPF